MDLVRVAAAIERDVAADPANPPEALLNHQWSALNYPLLWAAADPAPTTPIVDWLTYASWG